MIDYLILKKYNGTIYIYSCRKESILALVSSVWARKKLVLY
jgi:hypothetical protein